MSVKKYYWLKLKEDFFRQKEIKKLRKIAGGDTYTIIYLKMQLLSIKNNGILRFDGLEESFADEIALELDEDAENVKITMAYLKAAKLLEVIEDNEYMLIGAVNSTGSEVDSAERVRKHRARKALPSDASVTTCNTEIEIKKEINNKKTEEQPKNGADAQSVFNHYYIKYETHYKAKPVCNVGRFIKTIKDILVSSSLDELKGMIDYIWNDNFVIGAGHSPETVFSGSSVAKFRAFVATQPKCVKIQEPTRAPDDFLSAYNEGRI